ncbi:hypothetical protein N9138_00975 [bacterium]|nr:hypothetical protein [bacterium]MDB4759527.1 hypothetical protein [Akkermansiaceae bacterium]
MNSLVKLLVILFCILPATQSKAEEFKVEWEKTLRPFEFWEQATRAETQVWADEKGGSVVKLGTQPPSPSNGYKEFWLFLDRNGEERYRLEFSEGKSGTPIIISSRRVVIAFSSQTTSGTETISFNNTGQATRTSSASYDSQFNNSSVGLYNSDFKSCFYTVAYAKAAGGLITNSVIKKWSFGADNSPETAPVLFSGVNGENAIVSWKSNVGSQYQVQKSTDLESWSDIGLPITGTGEQMNYSEANLGGQLYLRIVVL